MAGPSSSRFHCTWHLLSLSSFFSLGLTNHWQPHLAVTTQQLGTATTSPGCYCLKATRPTLLLSQAHLISVPSLCMVLRQEPNSLDYTTSQVERVGPGHCLATAWSLTWSSQAQNYLLSLSQEATPALLHFCLWQAP